MNSNVILVSMPFAPVVSPSIGLSLLKGALLRKNIESEILYLNLHFAAEVGPKFYSKISTGFPVNHDMLGEWLFSHSLFENTELNNTFIDEILLGKNPLHNKSKYNRKKITPGFITQVLKAKEKVSAFIHYSVQLVLKNKPKIVGFTSVFQQQIASLALAKCIKALSPDTIICFGGANNEGNMGLEVMRKFSFVDYVVSGEGEEAFPWLVSELLLNKSVDNYQGIISKANVHSFALNQTRNAKMLTAIDDLPFVEYDEYFMQLKDVRLDKEFSTRILFETSRGCWWGMKNHCTFCGLNGETMTQRTKSASRALEEFRYLLEKYPGQEISVVDNILDYNYFNNFIPALIDLKKEKQYELFYEVKANLTKEQLKMLRDAGITIIQPGIESFCKKTLKLMRKGVSPLQNLQLLKWCKELNIGVEWNILYGFPHEDPEEYLQVAQMLPLLSHLTPPNSCSPIRLDRFSPNFNQSGELGFKDIKPYPTYHHIYPFEPESVFNLAYYFTYGYQDYTIDYKKMKIFVRGIKNWKTQHDQSALFYSENEDHLLIWDLRSIAKHPIYILSGLTKQIYLLCDKAIRPTQLLQKLQEQFPSNAEIGEEITNKLAFLLDNGLIILYDDHYLSLAISDKELTTTQQVVTKINHLVSSSADSQSGEFTLKETVFA